MTDQEKIVELVRVLEALSRINGEQLRANAKYDDDIAAWMPAAYQIIAKARA